MSGKLNGEMTPMTPRGRRRARLMRPGSDGSTSPCGSMTMAAAVLMRMGAERTVAVATVARSRPMAGPEAGAQSELLTVLADKT